MGDYAYWSILTSLKNIPSPILSSLLAKTTTTTSVPLQTKPPTAFEQAIVRRYGYLDRNANPFFKSVKKLVLLESFGLVVGGRTMRLNERADPAENRFRYE